MCQLTQPAAALLLFLDTTNSMHAVTPNDQDPRAAHHAVPTAIPSALDAATAAAHEVVTVCVGGTLYTTTRSTLTAVPGSYLAILFGGSSSHWRPSLVLPDSKVPFIDRDGQLFRFILAYLRSLNHPNCQQLQQLAFLPSDEVQLQLLQAEADFYGLPGLAAMCGSRTRSHKGRAASICAQLAALEQAQLHQGQQQQQQQHSKQLLQQQQQQQQQEEPAQPGPPSPSAHSSSVSAADVHLGMQPQQQRSCSQTPLLASAMLQAHQLQATQQQAWLQDPTLQQHADLVLRHLLQLPLEAQQPDLVAALVNTNEGSRLRLSLSYFPVGDTRIDIQCHLVPSGTEYTVIAATAAAAAGAGLAAGAANNATPNLSPRNGMQQQQQQRRSTISSADEFLAAAPADAASGAGAAIVGPSRALSGSLSPEAAAGVAAAAAAAAAAAVSSYAGSAPLPGPGWGSTTMYHRFTIKEAHDRFVLTTQRPGEAQEVQEVAPESFRQELKRYSALHKLCVQQCPRFSVAGLMWLLEEAGFSGVRLSTCLEAYQVGRNSFTGFTAIITCSTA